MITLAMCDDDKNSLQWFKKTMNKLKEKYDMEIELYFFSSAIELLKKKKMIQMLDVLFLDIFMPDLNGIEAAEIIRNINKEVKIVFLSSTPDYVFDSFQVSASNYLLKENIDEESLCEVVLKLYNELNAKNVEFYICKSMYKKVILDIREIIAFDVVLRKTNVHTLHDSHICYDSINRLYEMYQNMGFYMINRSCIINLKYVQMIENTEVVMMNDVRFQISVRKIKGFETAFLKYLKNMN